MGVRVMVRAWPEGVAFAWAVGEATLLPLMPDAIIVPLALARPNSWWRLSIAAMLGSSVGGAVSYWLGQRNLTRASVERLPLVRPEMVAAVEEWLSDEGA